MLIFAVLCTFFLTGPQDAQRTLPPAFMDQPQPVYGIDRHLDHAIVIVEHMYGVFIHPSCCQAHKKVETGHVP